MDTQSHYLVFPPSFGEPLQSIGFPSGRPFSLPRDPSYNATSHIRKITQDRRKKQKNLRDQGESRRCATTYGGMLPEDILLEIFDFYRKDHEYANRGVVGKEVWSWHLLVHVCRRWRQVIFESPCRLNLRIFCTEKTPIRKNLGIWPAFPIVVCCYPWGSIAPRQEANLIAALRHPDRVCSVTLRILGPQVGKVATVMQEPFPVLTYLRIWSGDENTPVLPGEFLGGSATCLQTISLQGIPFPALPTLLLSTNDLVRLELREIPPTGYISPEAMVACLAALPRLDTFIIEFRLATPRPNQIRTVPPVTRTVLPSLTYFQFNGASEYLEDLVAQIDCPQLDYIRIAYLNQLVDFQVGQLSKFIDRSVGSELTSCISAIVTFHNNCVSTTYGRGRRPAWTLKPAYLKTFVYCKEIDWQVSHMAQVLSHFSVTPSAIILLDLESQLNGLQLRGTDHVEWQHLLRQFSTVKMLCVSQVLAEHVALALEDITEEIVAEVLPPLALIRLEGQPASSIKRFIAVRQLSGRPVTVINSARETARESYERLESYAT